LSNDFFRIFLDERMVYSCAWFEDEDESLDRAQWNKLDRVCRKLDLRPEDHLLEIGCGWGALAVHAATRYGCRVTGVTISRAQFEHASELVCRLGLEDRVRVILEDYRQLRGRFDKIASIEMFEAVGFDYYDSFFGLCDRLLTPEGVFLLQTITMNDQTFPAYRRRCDFIQKHIFPGSELASLAGVLASLGRSSGLGLYHCEDIGAHYTRTLAAWRQRFLARLPEAQALGFDERFLRLWEYYLAYCEGAFLERHISNVQLVLVKNGVSRAPARPSAVELSSFAALRSETDSQQKMYP
jgi:cyclopropane-fatty-acyl-phospholipid synthase